MFKLPFKLTISTNPFSDYIVISVISAPRNCKQPPPEAKVRISACVSGRYQWPTSGIETFNFGSFLISPSYVSPSLSLLGFFKAHAKSDLNDSRPVRTAQKKGLSLCKKVRRKANEWLIKHHKLICKVLGLLISKKWLVFSLNNSTRKLCFNLMVMHHPDATELITDLGAGWSLFTTSSSFGSSSESTSIAGVDFELACRWIDTTQVASPCRNYHAMGAIVTHSDMQWCIVIVTYSDMPLDIRC